MKKNILIFSASIGNGHDSAAASLREYFQAADKECTVSVIDCFAFVSPSLARFVSAGYFKTLHYSPALWGYLYGHTERSRDRRWLNTAATLFFHRFDELIVRSRPDVVLATHPFAAAVLSALKQRRGRQFCLCSVVTDFGVHSLWLYPATDLYFLPSAEAMAECCQRGIDEEHLCCSGIPVKASFAEDHDRNALRCRLGLDERPVLLLVGGGCGLGRLREAAETLSAVAGKYQLVAVAGNNEPLAMELRTLAAHNKDLRVFGYVDNMAEWMAAADLVIGKCGGLTAAEAAAIGVPMLILDPLPGHERRNAEYFRSMGGAAEVGELSALLPTVEELLGVERQQAMRSAMSRLGHRDAAQVICRRALQWQPSAEAPSVETKE